MSTIDDRFLSRWHDSQRRQRAMREYLAKSQLDVESFEGRTLNLIAEAFTKPTSQRTPRPSSVATMSVFATDDR